MKFGGALMGDASGIKRVVGLIEEFSCEPLVVVVSALGKTTNSLEDLYHLHIDNIAMENSFFVIKQNHIRISQELFPEINNDLTSDLNKLFDELWDALNIRYSSRYESYDTIVSFGEELSSCIIYHYLKSCSISTRLINSKSLIITDSNFTDASVNWDYTTKTINSRVVPVIDNGHIVLTQGFTAADMKGRSTTLGREGSDFTAAIYGNILDVDEVTIWKNVPGLMNADPQRFPDAVKIERLSYHEAIELAYYGASVIHPKTIQPLKQKSIPLFVRSYLDPGLTPTSISNSSSNDPLTSSIIVKDNQVLLSIGTQNLSFIAEDNLRQIFDAFSKNKIHINLMQNSAVSFSVCFNDDSIKLESLISDLKETFTLKYNSGLELITVRHYTDKQIDELVGSRGIYLVQKSRTTIQLLVKVND